MHKSGWLPSPGTRYQPRHVPCVSLFTTKIEVHEPLPPLSVALVSHDISVVVLLDIRGCIIAGTIE
jgi:hypothetical protein